jgi:hypothetical protein
MLCRNCANIDLKDAFGSNQDTTDIPLRLRNMFSPRILHYKSYAGIVGAAESCQLCALVVKGFDASQTVRPSPEQSIYRSVGRGEYAKDLHAEPGRHLMVMRFGSVWDDHEMSMNLDQKDYCEVELYVDEGTLYTTIHVISYSD